MRRVLRPRVTVGVLSSCALAWPSALDGLRSVLGHSELKFACIFLIMVLRLVAVGVFVILFVILPDLLCLNDAHPNSEDASSTHEKLTRVRVLGAKASSKGITRRPSCQVARPQLAATSLHHLIVSGLLPPSRRLALLFVSTDRHSIIAFFS